MHEELIQYNSGDHVLGNKNVAEAVTTDGDIVFNESYIVVGESLKARNIHATYDLDVMTDVVAGRISVNGNLFVKGDIEALQKITEHEQNVVDDILILEKKRQNIVFI